MKSQPRTGTRARVHGSQNSRRNGPSELHRGKNGTFLPGCGRPVTSCLWSFTQEPSRPAVCPGGPQSLPHAQCRPRPPSPRPGPPGGGRCPAVPLGPGCEHRWPLPTPPFTWLSSRAPGRLGQGPRRCGGGPGLACPSWASIQAHTCEGPFHRLPNESESHLEPTTSCSGRAGGQNRER